MNTKKAQGLSLNMIVIGAIALVVLVVVITIFISGARSTRPKEEKSCAEANGVRADLASKGVHFVISPTQCVAIGGSPILGKFSDVTPPMVCCNKGACDNRAVIKYSYNGGLFDTYQLAIDQASAEDDYYPTIDETPVCGSGAMPRNPGKYQKDCCI